MKLKRGIAAVFDRKRPGFPKVIICDTKYGNEAEMVMATLNLGDYYLEYRDFTTSDPTEESEKS